MTQRGLDHLRFVIEASVLGLPSEILSTELSYQTDDDSMSMCNSSALQRHLRRSQLADFTDLSFFF